MSLEQDLLNLKTKGEQLNTLKIQNATKLASLEEEKNKLLAEVQELGIEPTQLEEVLRIEEAAIQEATLKLSEELNRVLDEVNRV